MCISPPGPNTTARVYSKVMNFVFLKNVLVLIVQLIQDLNVMLMLYMLK